jgi:hypothetical protein
MRAPSFQFTRSAERVICVNIIIRPHSFLAVTCTFYFHSVPFEDQCSRNLKPSELFRRLHIVASLLVSFFLTSQVHASPWDDLFNFPDVRDFLASHSDWKEKVSSAKHELREAEKEVIRLREDALTLSQEALTAMQSGNMGLSNSFTQQVNNMQPQIDKAEDRKSRAQNSIQMLLDDVHSAMKE